MSYSTRAQRKEKATEHLDQLGVDERIIEEFEKDDTVYLFETNEMYPIQEKSYLGEIIKRLEEQFKCTVYGVTHTYTYFGECYEFLLVSYAPEDWDIELRSNGNNHIAMAWVENKDVVEHSEMGSVLLRNYHGNLVRII